MPPFRVGLLKRKIENDKSEPITSEKPNEDESSAEEDLIRGVVQDDDGSSDSEQEPGAHSDGEVDEVLFENDADSTLGDEGEEDEATDGSSDITDSDADSSNDDDDGETSNEEEQEGSESDGEASADSGTESGPARTHSGSSDEADKVIKETKQKDKVKQKKSKGSNQKEQLVKEKESAMKSSVDILAEKIKETSMQTKPVVQKDEYESGDTSDEEDRVNTRGAVPAWWYSEYEHVGYDLDGRRIMKPPQRDRIDDFLKQCSDPEFWRTVRDPGTAQDVVLSADDLRLIENLRAGRAPAPHDPYEPWVEWFSREVMSTPLRAFPEHKRSFLPSRAEQKQIGRIVHALKMGWMKTRKQIADERRNKKERRLYDLWGSESAPRGIHRHIPAPRRPPPTHAESYNPPPEYLLDRREMKEWNKLAATPWRRKHSFLPRAHGSLRAVPAYERFVRERFLRCLDLYLAPRAIKMRLTISPEELVPKLPSPRELQPFPTSEVVTLRGHADIVRAADFDPSGQYAASASDDGTVKVWEVATGRCVRTVELGAGVGRLRWCPARGLSLLAAACQRRLLLINPGAAVADHRVAARTDELLEEPPPQHDTVMDARSAAAAAWDAVAPAEWARGVRVAVSHFQPITHIQWHGRGDYLVVTLAQAAARAVVVHQVSRRRSQLPLNKAKGLVQCAVFLPNKPHLAVATQRAVRIYDVAAGATLRRLVTGAQWISGLAPHPSGDHLLVTTYERKLLWFDLELSAAPYQTLRVHGRAARAASFHRRYPLLASAGDDPYVVVTHATVYNDLLQNPLIVPVKQLPALPPAARAPPAPPGAPAAPAPRPRTRNSQVDEDSPLKVLDVVFHPLQPWLLVARADHTLGLYA